MQSLFRGSTWLSHITALSGRAGTVALFALIYSQGCGIISDTPNRTLSTRGIPSAESQTGNLSTDTSTTPSLRRETPPIAKAPSPQIEQSPRSAKFPATSLPTMETGLASWYGPRFHGKLTASGEVFNQEKLTAAHPTLPLGSRVKVINLDNGKTVDVRINDRGPYKGGRVIDVSRAAARTLGMMTRGIATVRIERLSDSEGQTILSNRP